MSHRLLFIFFSLFSCLSFAQDRQAQQLGAIPEYQMKAAYVYNFAQLTEWPDFTAKERDFTICIAAQDEVFDALGRMSGRLVNGRSLRVFRVRQLMETRQCHVLYVGEGQGQLARRMLANLRGKPVLTATDDPNVVREGVMLLIVNDGKRLAFEVQLEHVEASQLVLSSKLMRLASQVNQR